MSSHPLASAGAPPAQLAKAALKRLAETRLEPTPENYRDAYLAEAGQGAPDHAGRVVFDWLLNRAAPQLKGPEREALLQQLCLGQWPQAEQHLRASGGDEGAAWADLIDHTVRAVSRSSRQWTAARRNGSLQRVLTGSRSDAAKLQQRLSQLVSSWDSDGGEADALAEVSPAAPDTPAPASVLSTTAATTDATAAATNANGGPDIAAWPRVVDALGATVHAALPSGEPRADALSSAFKTLHIRTQDGVPASLADDFEQACKQAQRLLAHRHHFTQQLGDLSRELTASLAELSEDDSWVQGQCQAMAQHLDDGLTARNVRSVNQLLEGTRARQRQLRDDRLHARDALKQAIHRMLHEIGELGTHTGRFEESIGRYADVIGQADSLESLAGVVHEMVDETRTVHALVSTTQQRLQAEHGRAAELSDRVQALEDELRRVSQEVATDALTQVPNRRGLLQAFEREQGCARRDATSLAVGLLDIDNFKRLNDQLGHNTGDAALRFLVDRVSASLRPGDTLGRWGGEEFVVLLPGTTVDDAQQTLTRLQRTLSAELFMYEGKQSFVTFSAGVTVWREGEAIESALERADEALYEAKHSGKNRTCVG